MTTETCEACNGTRVRDAIVPSNRPVPVLACFRCLITWVEREAHPGWEHVAKCPCCGAEASHEGLLPLRSLSDRKVLAEDRVPGPHNPPKPFMGPREVGG